MSSQDAKWAVSAHQVVSRGGKPVSTRTLSRKKHLGVRCFMLGVVAAQRISKRMGKILTRRALCPGKVLRVRDKQ